MMALKLHSLTNVSPEVEKACTLVTIGAAMKGSTWDSRRRNMPPHRVPFRAVRYSLGT